MNKREIKWPLQIKVKLSSGFRLLTAFCTEFTLCRFFLPLTAQQSRERNLNRGRIIYEHIQRLIYSSGITRGKPYPKFPK